MSFTARNRSQRSTFFSPQRQRLVMIVLTCAFVISGNLYGYARYMSKFKDCRVPWQDIASSKHAQPLKIALVTMSTGAHTSVSKAAGQQNLHAAEYAGTLALTGPNKVAYAREHKYTYIDASVLLDTTRPASWSKIKAVLHHLPRYDWVFWMDADTIITNGSIKVESLLPSVGSLDFIVTKDSTGFNAGTWLVRNSAWSRYFLEEWWAMTSFIRKPGDTKSGDNDALKFKLINMHGDDFGAHVGIAPQCAFNSYMWRGSLRNWIRYFAHPAQILTGLWLPGDFVLHLAGVFHKNAALKRVLSRPEVPGSTWHPQHQMHHSRAQYLGSKRHTSVEADANEENLASGVGAMSSSAEKVYGVARLHEDGSGHGHGSAGHAYGHKGHGHHHAHEQHGHQGHNAQHQQAHLHGHQQGHRQHEGHQTRQAGVHAGHGHGKSDKGMHTAGDVRAEVQRSSSTLHGRGGVHGGRGTVHRGDADSNAARRHHAQQHVLKSHRAHLQKRGRSGREFDEQ